MAVFAKGGLSIKQEWECWYNLENPDVTLNEAIDKLQKQAIKENGKKMKILEKDYLNKRVKVLYVTSEGK